MLRNVMAVMVLVVMSAGVASAGVSITLNEVAGDPVVVRQSGGSHQRTMTMNRNSQVLYVGTNYNGGTQVHHCDAGVTKLVSEANVNGVGGNDASMGTARSYLTTEYVKGSVVSGPPTSIREYSTLDVAWNPTSNTVMTQQSTNYNTFRVAEVICQTAGQAWSVVNEGQAVANGAGQVNTVAVAALTADSVPGNSLLDASPGGGMAWADNVNIGGTDYDRLFVGLLAINGGTGLGKRVGVVWMEDVISGWDATTVGSRATLQPHNGDDSATGTGSLLTDSEYGALVDVATDEGILDIAVYDGMLFILSYSAANTDTYLSAVTYTLPTDGISAVSVDSVVNLGGATDYLTLDGMVPGISSGSGGLAFGADSGSALMYVAAADGLIYTFNAEPPPPPVAEPGCTALLLLGGVFGLRRRRH
jgi:MYXO-CTERM domain-containing protein